MARTILIVDDEKSIQTSLEGALSDEGYSVTLASNGAEALQKLSQEQVDLVLLDIWMPGMDGIEALQKMRGLYPEKPVIMMSGHGTIETAVKATKLGAFDFAEKPLSLERLLVLIQNALRTHDLARENTALRSQVRRDHALIGDSPKINQIKDKLKQVAPTTGSVLITGENGTGKELVAHNIHSLSPRFNKPFIEVNCAAIPEELIESELFGHEKGAFTGAIQQKKGKFDLAHTGTLFLDEIGDMSLKTQAKVLRILQEQKFERVGGTKTVSVDVRIVAATNKDLKSEINNGRFREDLYYRLNVVPFQMPALRERRDDIPELAEYFLNEFSHAHQKKKRTLTDEARSLLMSYSWPGNVRELKNLIERLVILTESKSENEPITAALLLEHFENESFVSNLEKTEAQSLRTQNLRDARADFEKDFIIQILKQNGGNVSKTATALGIERSHLHKKMKSYGLD